MDAPTRVALVAAFLWTTPALALEPTGSLMGDAFLKTLEANGYEGARAQHLSRQNGTITLDGVTAQAPDGPRLTIANVTLTAPSLTAEEALSAERIRYAGVRLDEPAHAGAAGSATTIGAVTLDAPVLPTVGRSERRLSGLAGAFSRLALTDLSTTTRGQEGDAKPLTIAGLALTLRAPDAGGDGGRLVIDRLAFAVDILDGDTAARLAGLGIHTLSLDFVGEAAWNRQTGALSLPTATVRAADLGTLAISAELTGVTDASVARLRDSLSDIATLLGALDSTGLQSLTLAYVDDGLADTLLAQGASEVGVDGAAFRDQLVGRLNGALGLLGDAAFSTRASEAIVTFLADPGRIAIAAAPREPLSLAQIAGVALMRPAALPALLNLTVEAAP